MVGVSRPIRVDDGPVRALFDRLVELDAEIGAPRGPFDAIGAAMVAATQLRFDRGVGPDGQPWLPSRRVTEGGKRDDGTWKNRTLAKSGHLKGSLTHAVSGDQVAWGTNVIYAAIHQFGGEIVARIKSALRFFVPGDGEVFARKVRIPARPYLGANDDDLDEIGAILGDFITAAIGGAPAGAGGTGAATP